MSTASIPAISVIIPVHNGASAIGMQLDALRAQLDAPSFEIVIVDNQSTDALDDVVNSRRAAFDELRIVPAPARPGASYARNVGGRAARAQLLMFCDADDIVSEFWLAHGAIAFGSADLWSGAAIPVPDDNFDSNIEAIRQRIGDSAMWEALIDAQNTAFPILMGGNFGVTAKLFYELGGFDESLPNAGEDNEFAVRARLNHHRIPIAPSVRLAYRIRTDSTARRHQQFAAARAHALIASRYRLWHQSPYDPPTVALLKCVLAWGRMCIQPKRRDWSGLHERFAFATGLAVGAFKYRLLRAIPKAEYSGIR